MLSQDQGQGQNDIKLHGHGMVMLKGRGMLLRGALRICHEHKSACAATLSQKGSTGRLQGNAPVGDEELVRVMTALPPSIIAGVIGTPQPRKPSLTALL